MKTETPAAGEAAGAEALVQGHQKTTAPPGSFQEPITMLEFACEYAAIGFRIFPIRPFTILPDGTPACSCTAGPKCAAIGKHPAIKWKAGATCDPAIVRGWWSGRFASCGIGCATGASGLVVFDADAAKGIFTMARLLGGAKLATARAKTGRGWHIYTRGEAPCSSDPVTKLDVRSVGGYTVLPPSPHASGVAYAWEAAPWDTPIASCPPALLDYANTKKKRPGGPAQSATKVSERQRAPGWGDGIRPDYLQCATPDFSERLAGLLEAPDWGEVRRALQHLDADCGRDEWLRVGMALHQCSNGSLYALELWDAWSSGGHDKYKGREDVESEWNSFQIREDGVGLGSLFALAFQHGFQWSGAMPHAPDAPPTSPASTGAAATNDGVIKASSFVWREPSTIPPRRFLYARHLVRQYISVTVGPGGLGKTALLLAECLVMVTGRNLLGHDVPAKMRVWYWNGEDPKEEIERRIAAICRLYGIKSEDIGDRLFVDSGRDMEIKIARDEKSGFSIALPTVDAIKRTIIENRIDVMIVDPFVSSHAVTENDNTRIDAVAKAWGRIAGETNCAIELSHHTRKGAHGQFEHAVEDARGASALIAAARSARVLNQMSEEEARNFGLGPPGSNQRRRYFRVDNGKANLAPPPDNADWYFFESVCLGNGGLGLASGDNVGVVTTWSPPDPLQSITEDDLRAILERVATGEYRANAQAEDWVGKAVADVLQLNIDEPSVKARVKALLKMWIKSGVLAVVPKNDEKRRKRDYVRVGIRSACTTAPPPKGGAVHVEQVERQPAPPPPP